MARIFPSTFGFERGAIGCGRRRILYPEEGFRRECFLLDTKFIFFVGYKVDEFHGCCSILPLAIKINIFALQTDTHYAQCIDPVSLDHP
jgi:hypothetical protein